MADIQKHKGSHRQRERDTKTHGIKTKREKSKYKPIKGFEDTYANHKSKATTESLHIREIHKRKCPPQHKGYRPPQDIYQTRNRLSLSLSSLICSRSLHFHLQKLSRFSISYLYILSLSLVLNFLLLFRRLYLYTLFFFLFLTAPNFSIFYDLLFLYFSCHTLLYLCFLSSPVIPTFPPSALPLLPCFTNAFYLSSSTWFLSPSYSWRFQYVSHEYLQKDWQFSRTFRL